MHDQGQAVDAVDARPRAGYAEVFISVAFRYRALHELPLYSSRQDSPCLSSAASTTVFPAGPDFTSGNLRRSLS